MSPRVLPGRAVTCRYSKEGQDRHAMRERVTAQLPSRRGAGEVHMPPPAPRSMRAIQHPERSCHGRWATVRYPNAQAEHPERRALARSRRVRSGLQSSPHPSTSPRDLLRGSAQGARIVILRAAPQLFAVRSRHLRLRCGDSRKCRRGAAIVGAARRAFDSVAETTPPLRSRCAVLDNYMSDAQSTRVQI